VIVIIDGEVLSKHAVVADGYALASHDGAVFVDEDSITDDDRAVVTLDVGMLSQIEILAEENPGLGTESFEPGGELDSHAERGKSYPVKEEQPDEQRF
jgi:hypothetical protein